MMRELADNILDIAQNSIAAGVAGGDRRSVSRAQELPFRWRSSTTAAA